MTTYKCDLNQGQQLYLQNQEMQTVVKLISTSVGQQQSTSSSFETGKWQLPPVIFRTAAGVIIQIAAERGQQLIQVQAQGISILKASPSLSHADALPIQPVETEVGTKPNTTMPRLEPLPSMAPMQPMKPMQMGDMHMDLGRMEMRLGNMEMRLGTPADQETAPKQSNQNFCSQCGSKVAAGDRFCVNCGHQLMP